MLEQILVEKFGLVEPEARSLLVLLLNPAMCRLRAVISDSHRPRSSARLC
jgi:hypothetical protein